jgi:hypothetical protein
MLAINHARIVRRQIHMSNQLAVDRKSTSGVYFKVMESAAELIEEGSKPMGGQKSLAAALKVTPQAVAKWKLKGVPSVRVLDLERVTGISRHRIRPDLYPIEASK